MRPRSRSRGPRRRRSTGIGRWCEEQGVDAWYRAGGYLQVSTAPAHDGTWREVAAACEELGVRRRAAR